MVTFSDRWSHCIKYAVQRHKMKPPNLGGFLFVLWRSGQNLSALQAAMNFGHRKSASRGVASVRKNNNFFNHLFKTFLQKSGLIFCVFSIALLFVCFVQQIC